MSPDERPDLDLFDVNVFVGRRVRGGHKPAVSGSDLLAVMDSYGVRRAVAWHIAQLEHSPVEGNVLLELTAVPDERTGVIEKFVREAGSTKVVFGTDFPWFSHHYYIGAVLAADITDEERRDIFCRNAERILRIAR